MALAAEEERRPRTGTAASAMRVNCSELSEQQHPDETYLPISKQIA